jgi:hypothetical protein
LDNGIGNINLANKVTPLNKRLVEDTYTQTHNAVRQALGYYRFLTKQEPNAHTQEFCQAIQLIAQAEHKLANTLTNIEMAEAA